MSKQTAMSSIKKALKGPAGQVAGKTAAVVGGGTAAAFAIPTAAGAGLQNLGGKTNEGTGRTFKGVAVLFVLALIAGLTIAFFQKVIK